MSITARAGAGAGAGAGGRRPAAAVRALSALVASGAALAGLALGAAAPAHADTHLTLRTSEQEVRLTAGPPGQQGQPQTVSAFVLGGDDQHIDRVQVRAELSGGLAGAATATWPEGCTPSGADSALCDVAADDQITVTLRAAAGAPHATGTLTFTGVSANLAGEAASTAVTVESGPAVYVVGVPARTKAKPGQDVPLPFDLVNAGDQAGDGAIVSLWISPGLDIDGRSSSCLYSSGGVPSHVQHVVCFLDAVSPGTTVSYAHALTFTAKPSSLIEDVEMSVGADTSAAHAAALRDFDGVPGTGPALKPDGSTAGIPSAGLRLGADPKIDVDNTAEMSVTTPSPLKGANGATLDVDLAVTNHGPADYMDSWDEFPAAYVELVPPPGTTISSFVDVGCFILAKDDKTVIGNGKPRTGDRVVCKTSYVFFAGRTEHFSFTLHVDKVIPGATGKAYFRTDSPEGRPMPWDKNTANNSAAFVLNPAKGGGTSGGSSGSGGSGTTGGTTAGTASGGSGTSAGGTAGGSATAGTTTGATTGSASGSSGGTSGTSPDGSLAATGSGTAPLITALAGTACAAGAAVLLLARSRRRAHRGAARP
ncbi:hypothetical protein [Streptomyces sp. HPF1205]|uniref:hypothetical protein n=1 Tax=Streptomyces sp. HPF1205 TaxID=2873262 RepID=UPI001CECCB57|nr:hypothetical protein [Streptomyces sp. HPF1205]